MNQGFYSPSGVADDQSGHKPPLVKNIGGQNMTALPGAFIPGENDVICGRGRKAFNHIGNANFRKLVAKRLDEYSSASAKLEKSYILSDIVCEVRQRSPTGGFVKRDTSTGHWYEVGDFLAREKTSQAFRDALHDQYKSSNTAKKKRRQQEQAEKLMGDQNSSSSSSLGFSPDQYSSMQKPPLMPVRSFEPKQDSLLGALDVEISASLNNNTKTSNFNGQASLRSVVDFTHPGQQQQQQQESWLHNLNQSCPNIGGSSGWNSSSSPVSAPSSAAVSNEKFNRSAPHMQLDDDSYDSPARTQHKTTRTSGSFMDVEPAFPDEQHVVNLMDEFPSESFGDDLILSPIGDGSPRRLFNSLSKLEPTPDTYRSISNSSGVPLHNAPMLE